MKTSFIVVLVGVVIGAMVLIVLKRDPPDKPSFEGELDQVVSESAVHLHPELSIYVKGEKQEIPADIGIGQMYKDNKFYDPMMDMTDIHTHDASGALHWEVMEGPVKKGDLRLRNFFEIWDRQLDFTQAKMYVNGELNGEFEDYLVKDKDKIEIRIE